MDIDIKVNIYICQLMSKSSHPHHQDQRGMAMHPKISSRMQAVGGILSGRMLSRPDTGPTSTLVCLDGDVRKPTEIG
jgi:hypothetical protein